MTDFSQAAQTAKNIVALFASDSDLTVGSSALTTSQTSKGIAHGLSGTPDFVLLGSSAAAAAAAEGIGWTANATTLTLTKVDTQAEATISYLVGNFS